MLKYYLVSSDYPILGSVKLSGHFNKSLLKELITDVA